MMVVVCLPARVLFYGLKTVGVALEGIKWKVFLLHWWFNLNKHLSFQFVFHVWFECCFDLQYGSRETKVRQSHPYGMWMKYHNMIDLTWHLWSLDNLQCCWRFDFFTPPQREANQKISVSVRKKCIALRENFSFCKRVRNLRSHVM